MTPEALETIRNQLTQAKTRLEELKGDIADAERAGVAVADLRGRALQMEKYIARLESVYGPKEGG